MNVLVIYPEAVQCDTIYRNRENIKYCKELNIRISGPPLGRKKKDNTLKKQIKRDAVERIEVERKFGLAKRRYNMNLVMEKLPETTFTAVALTILMMNLDKILKSILLCLNFISNHIIIFELYIKKQNPLFSSLEKWILL